jgi:hypothetical protein
MPMLKMYTTNSSSDKTRLASSTLRWKAVNSVVMSPSSIPFGRPPLSLSEMLYLRTQTHPTNLGDYRTASVQ